MALLLIRNALATNFNRLEASALAETGARNTPPDSPGAGLMRASEPSIQLWPSFFCPTHLHASSVGNLWFTFPALR